MTGHSRDATKVQLGEWMSLLGLVIKAWVRDYFPEQEWFTDNWVTKSPPQYDLAGGLTGQRIALLGSSAGLDLLRAAWLVSQPLSCNSAGLRMPLSSPYCLYKLGWVRGLVRLVSFRDFLGRLSCYFLSIKDPPLECKAFPCKVQLSIEHPES